MLQATVCTSTADTQRLKSPRQRWQRDEVSVLFDAWNQVARESTHQSTAATLTNASCKVVLRVARRFNALLRCRMQPTRRQSVVKHKMQELWYTYHCVLEFRRRRAKRLATQQSQQQVEAETNRCDWFALAPEHQRAFFLEWEGNTSYFLVDMDADAVDAMRTITETTLDHQQATSWGEDEVDALVFAWCDIVSKLRTNASETTTVPSPDAISLRFRACCCERDYTLRTRESVAHQLQALVATYHVICRHKALRASCDWFACSILEQMQFFTETRTPLPLFGNVSRTTFNVISEIIAQMRPSLSLPASSGPPRALEDHEVIIVDTDEECSPELIRSQAVAATPDAGPPIDVGHAPPLPVSPTRAQAKTARGPTKKRNQKRKADSEELHDVVVSFRKTVRQLTDVVAQVREDRKTEQFNRKEFLALLTREQEDQANVRLQRHQDADDRQCMNYCPYSTRWL